MSFCCDPARRLPRWCAPASYRVWSRYRENSRESQPLDRRAAQAANAPGVVTVKFIDNVDEFVGARDVDAALTELQEKYSALKGLEGRLQQRRVKLMQKLPDIKKALDMVQARRAAVCARPARAAAATADAAAPPPPPRLPAAHREARHGRGAQSGLRADGLRVCQGERAAASSLRPLARAGLPTTVAVVAWRGGRRRCWWTRRR